MKMKLRVLLGASALLPGLAVPAALTTALPAGADPASAPLCSTAGTALSGSYHNLTVTGNSYVADMATLNVSGNLRLAPGSCLDAFSLGTVQVGGNVLVGNGATLALGCAPGSNGPPPMLPCGSTTTDDTVGGNIVANNPYTMYLTAVTVGHNVVSNGGGPGATFDPYVNFPIKGMDIHGNLVVQGWQGAWFGAVRNTVDGNVILSHNVGANPDSTEIGSNTVGGNLICQGNSPPAQLGDAVETGVGPNTVAGRTIGQCALPADTGATSAS
ncbi:MAG: hypothetical protein ACRDYY_14545 [Acidimicrobiales bacterium]